MYYHEKGINLNLVVVDHESGRIFSYALPDKSVFTGNGWIQKLLARDIDNLGYQDVKVIVKSDQERSMVALQHEVQQARRGSTMDLS